MGNTSIFGTLHLILVVYAAIQIINSKVETGTKVLWILLVAILPLVGLIAWFFAGPGSPQKK